MARYRLEPVLLLKSSPLPPSRLAINPDDDAAFQRILNKPPRGLPKPVEQMLLDKREAGWEQQRQQQRRRQQRSGETMQGLPSERPVSLLGCARGLLEEHRLRRGEGLSGRQATALSAFVKLVAELQVWTIHVCV